MKDNLSGVFLLFAIILGNFVKETIYKDLYKILQNNYIIQLVILFTIIYFTINFTTNDIVHPKEHLFKTVIIFSLYLLWSHNYVYISLITFLLIVLNYVLNIYIEYHEKNNKDKKILDELKSYNKYFSVFIFIIIFIGFIFKLRTGTTKSIISSFGIR